MWISATVQFGMRRRCRAVCGDLSEFPHLRGIGGPHGYFQLILIEFVITPKQVATISNEVVISPKALVYGESSAVLERI